MNRIQHLMSGREVSTRQELLARGAKPRELAAAVHRGDLLRIRRGHYGVPALDSHSAVAVRIGGLLSCVSAAAKFGLWVPPQAFTHVAMRHEASRMRSPRNRFERLNEYNRDGCELHWWPLIQPDQATRQSVSLLDALVHVVRCQPRPIAVAAIDSALHQELIGPRELDLIFNALPARFGLLRTDLDGRAMSGIESITRLLARDNDVRCELQVRFSGIGIVDLLLEGCVVVETDGRLNHDGALESARDYDRDTALTALGYIVLRFNYRQVMFRPELVIATILQALQTHRGFAGT